MGKLEELVDKAKAIVNASSQDKMSIWRAYVGLEYAILDLKLRHNLEGQTPPNKPAKQATDIKVARVLLARLDLSSDKKRLLYDLRACRDILKALVANYDRRSTTS